MDIAHSKTREKYPLCFRKIWKKTISGTIVYAVVLVVFFLPMSAFIRGFLKESGLLVDAEVTTLRSFFFLQIIEYSFLILGALFVLILIAEYVYQFFYFKVYYYELFDNYLTIRKGPITPHEITVPYARMQDVYVDQDLFDRLFGLYDVHISSATVTSGMAAHVDGLEKEAANGLKEELLKKVTAFSL